MTAVQLARRGVPSVLIDGSGRMNRGVAYSTPEPVHLLNVPSGKMSAWPDRPADFADWLGDEGDTFAERRAFGRYLGHIADAHGDRVERRNVAVTGAHRLDGHWQISLADGSAMHASALVLGNGNQVPAPLGVMTGVPDGLFVNNPWGEDAKAAVSRLGSEGGDVLILGTGLTMIDTVLSLDAAGHRGRVVALSRRGLVPHPHAPHTPAEVAWEQIPAGNLLGLWRWLRRRSAEVGFRAAVDSLRPHSQRLWQSLPERQQRRFLRHARPWWDVHRHRIAPEIGRKLRSLVAEGRLEVVAGRLRSAEPKEGALQVSLTRRGSAEPEHRSFACAFNCTGPLGEMRRNEDPLLQHLLSSGTIRIDHLGMGLSVDRRSRAGERVWAVGPLTKGCYWEIVAVPDIRTQADAVADDIAQELGW